MIQHVESGFELAGNTIQNDLESGGSVLALVPPRQGLKDAPVMMLMGRGFSRTVRFSGDEAEAKRAVALPVEEAWAQGRVAVASGACCPWRQRARQATELTACFLS